MHLYKALGDPNIGLYCFTTNKFCLIGMEIPDKHVKKIEEALSVPVHRITIAGTSMVGAFVNGNDNCLLVPEITYDEELEQLDNLGIKYKVITSKLTALGNNIICNNNGIVLNQDFLPETVKEIEEALGIKSNKLSIADLDTVGSLVSLNSSYAIVHFDISDEEIQAIESTLKVKLFKGSVNLGNPYIRSGLLCNDNGLVAGGLTSGPELVDIDKNLGFLGD